MKAGRSLSVALLGVCLLRLAQASATAFSTGAEHELTNSLSTQIYVVRNPSFYLPNLMLSGWSQIESALRLQPRSV